MNQWKILTLVGALTAFLVFSCINRSYDYSLEVNNQSNTECSLLIESESGFQLTFSTLISQSLKTYNGPFSIPPNDIFTISWTSKNLSNIKYITTADLRSSIPKDFKGFLIFRITEGNNLIYSASHNYKGEELFSKTAYVIKKTT